MTSTLGGAFTVFDSTTGDAAYREWLHSATGSSPIVGRNMTGADATRDSGCILVPGSTWIHQHPGQAGQYSVTRWTAPSAGYFLLDAAFKTLRQCSCPASTDVHILVNGVSIFDSAVSGYMPTAEVPYAEILSLSADDTVDLAVGHNGTWECDSTGVRAVIVRSAAPTATVTPTATPTFTWTITPTFTSSPTPTVTATFEGPASACSFGASTIGSPQGFLGGGSTRFGMYVNPTLSVVSAVSFPLTISGSGASDQVRVFLYTVSGSTGLPENLVTQSEAVGGPFVSGWNTVPVTVATLEPGYYWIGASVNLVSDLHGWYSDQPTGGAYSVSTWLSGPAPDNLWNQTLGGLMRYTFRAVCSDVLTPTITLTPAASYTPTRTWTGTPTDTPTMTPTPTPTTPPSACSSFGASVPGTRMGDIGGGTARLARHTNSTLSTVTGVAFYLDWTYPASSAWGRVFIYTVSGSTGLPENLVAESVSTQPLGIGWNVLPVPATTLEPGDYWLGANVSVNGTNYSWYYDAPSGGALLSPYAVDDPAYPNLWNRTTGGQPRYTFRTVCSGVLTPTITGTPAASYTATPTWTPTFTSTFTPTFTNTPTLPPSGCHSFGAVSPGSVHGTVGGGSVRFAKHANPAPATVSGVAFHVDWSYPPAGSSARVFIYSSHASTGLPEARLAYSTVASPLVRGWNVVPIPPTELAAGDYWLGANVDMTESYTWYYDAVSPGAVMGAFPMVDPPPADLTGQVTGGQPRFTFRAICAP
jgi:hypothetical protein